MTRDALIAQGSEFQLKPHASVSFPLFGPYPSHHHQRLLPPLSWGILVIPEQLFAVPKKQLNHQTSLLGTIEEGGADGARSCLPSQQLGCSRGLAFSVWFHPFGRISEVG